MAKHAFVQTRLFSQRRWNLCALMACCSTL